MVVALFWLFGNRQKQKRHHEWEVISSEMGLALFSEDELFQLRNTLANFVLLTQGTSPQITSGMGRQIGAVELKVFAFEHGRMVDNRIHHYIVAMLTDRELNLPSFQLRFRDRTHQIIRKIQGGEVFYDAAYPLLSEKYVPMGSFSQLTPHFLVYCDRLASHADYPEIEGNYHYLLLFYNRPAKLQTKYVENAMQELLMAHKCFN